TRPRPSGWAWRSPLTCSSAPTPSSSSTWTVMIGAVELGLIYAVMALGVYLTFRILNFPDLTVDGSFTTGAATAAVLITGGTHPALATLVAGVAGLAAGVITGLLHAKGGINPLLAGILTQIG